MANMFNMALLQVPFPVQPLLTIIVVMLLISQDVYYSHYTGFVQPHYPQYHIATGNASDQYNTNAANHQYHSNNTASVPTTTIAHEQQE